MLYDLDSIRSNSNLNEDRTRDYKVTKRLRSKTDTTFIFEKRFGNGGKSRNDNRLMFQRLCKRGHTTMLNYTEYHNTHRDSESIYIDYFSIAPLNKMGAGNSDREISPLICKGIFNGNTVSPPIYSSTPKLEIQCMDDFPINVKESHANTSNDKSIKKDFRFNEESNDDRENTKVNCIKNQLRSNKRNLIIHKPLKNIINHCNVGAQKINMSTITNKEGNTPENKHFQIRAGLSKKYKIPSLHKKITRK
ncbi:uncharacterized protein SCDLUD_003626 [Saccharomycodes ludwigii]|uniref:uncharacterized protein n=1 Tax=Saccharomycodes ludwigii TaxID=36035 RepID=UPI001E850E7B|nr:hypothetical protein SCDLUD_003626 [Saccharomycodes ludwigii]KAH3900632.1 hypothetical protein SCDLUD_003626 [Saccharomycodes ludwigii]